MVEATAPQRAQIAIVTKARLAGEQFQLVVGDQVEFYRDPSHKDWSGWKGPARVVDVARLERGVA